MKSLAFGSMLLTSLLTTTYADTLKNTVTQTVLTNSEIVANQLKIKSTKKDIDIARAAYYPTLDFDTSFEKSQTQDHKKDKPTDPWAKKDGYKATLKAEQLLYNGGKTNNTIKEKEYKYLSTSFEFNQKNENIVFDIVTSYLDLVKFEELNQLMKYNDRAHAKALEIAYNKEEISGEALETLKTLAMISTQNDKKFAQEDKTKKAKAKYKKLTSIEQTGTICRPKTDKEVLPSTLEEIIKIVLKNNYKIKEQKEIIKKQKAIVGKENSNFRPTIKLNLDASYDDDLELDENGAQKEYAGKVSFKWNFYSGGGDKASASKEKITLHKEKKILEKISKKVIEDVTNLFNTHQKTISRVKNFKKALKTNMEILQLTRNQLEDGTKTFIDVLQAKAKLINSQTDMIKQEFILIETHYELLKELSMVTKTVVASEDQLCKKDIVSDLIKDEISNDEELDLLLEDDNTEITEEPQANELEENLEPTETPVEKIVQEDIEETLEDKLSKAFTNPNVTFEKDNLNLTLQITANSFNMKLLNPYDKFKYLLDSFSPKLLKTIYNNKNSIDSINIESFTSSEHRRFKDPLKIFQANKGLSQRRADKVKQYFIKKAIKEDLDMKWFSDHINALGKGPDQLITYTDGMENKKASRRIVIKIIKR